uniref:uncharacterized protein n=1 Tax=Myxine glutinosa TaxID=7769 RepID=UPI00358FC6C1
MNDAAFRAQLKETSKQNEPIVGMHCITLHFSKKNPSEAPYYSCRICGVKLVQSIIIGHITGNQHREIAVNAAFGYIIPVTAIKAQRIAMLNTVCAILEKKENDLFSYRIVYEDPERFSPPVPPNGMEPIIHTLPRNEIPHNDMGEMSPGEMPCGKTPHVETLCSEGPRGETPRGEMPQGDRPWSESPRTESPRTESPQDPDLRSPPWKHPRMYSSRMPTEDFEDERMQGAFDRRLDERSHLSPPPLPFGSSYPHNPHSPLNDFQQGSRNDHQCEYQDQQDFDSRLSSKKRDLDKIEGRQDHPPDFPRDHPVNFTRDIPVDFPRESPVHFPRHHQRDFSRGRQLDCPRNSQQDFPRDRRQDFPRGRQLDSPRDSQQELPGHRQHEFPGDHQLDFPGDRQQDFPPGLPNDLPPDFPKDLPPDFPNDLPPDFPKDLPPDFPKDLPPDFPKDLPPDFPKDLPPDFPKDLPPDFPKDLPPDFPKDLPPDFPKDLPPDFPKDLPPDFPKDLPPDFPKDPPPDFPRNLPPDFPRNHPPDIPRNLQPDCLRNAPLNSLNNPGHAKLQEAKTHMLGDLLDNNATDEAIIGHAKLQEAKTHMLGDLLDNNARDEAILGLSHINEHLSFEGKNQVVYSCSLCGCKPSMHAHEALFHIIGFDHRLNFLQMYYPSQLCADKHGGMHTCYTKHVSALAKEVQRLEGWSKHQIKSRSTSSLVQELMKVPKMKNKGFVEQLKELAKHNEPAIGANHITEHLCKNNPSALPYYTCELCDVSASRLSILSHVIGLKHRENVVMQYQSGSIPKNFRWMKKTKKRKMLKKFCFEVSKIEENPYSFKIVHEDQEKFAPPEPQPKTKEAIEHPLPHAQMQGAFGQLLPHLPGFHQGLPCHSDLPRFPPRLQLSFDDFQQDSRKQRELQYQDQHRFESRMGDSNRNDYLVNSDKGRDRPSNFPSDRPLNFPGDCPPSFPSHRTADFPSDRPPNFPGDRPLKYPGNRALNFPGDRPLSFPGDRTLSFPGDRPLNFPGDRTLSFSGDRAVSFPGDPPVSFPGDPPVSFPGDRAVSFPGDPPVSFPGDPPVSFPGDRAVSFPGDPPVSFPGDPPLSFTGDPPLRFPGDRPLRFPGDPPLRFPGDPPLSFPGDPPLRFPGDRPLRFPGDRPLRFPGDPPLRFPGDPPLRFPGDRGLRFPGNRPPSLFNNTGPCQGNFLQQRVPSYSQSQLVPPMGFPSINTARNRFPNLP